MKKIIAVMTLVLAGIVGVSAQSPVESQTANEFYLGASVTRADISANSELGFNADTDSVDVNAGYTRYFGSKGARAGVVGLGAELGYSFGDGDSNQVTALGNLTLKARNAKYFQPYARGLAGVAKKNVQVSNVLDRSDWASVYGAGVGTDVKFGKYSRYGARIGVDYLNTGFFGERQHGFRVVTGFVF
jgi:hypothetical protein